MSRQVTGQCLCGEVRYQVRNPATTVLNCHCRMCRKQHGAAFATWAHYRTPQFELLAGRTFLETYRSSEHIARQFCRTCGSSLFFVPLNDVGGGIWIAVGTLDGEPGRPVGEHIFTADKASWFSITDDLPQSDR
jgi:hypothetical protein